MAMQGEFQATTERDSVDEGEGRHSGCVELVEYGMPNARNGKGLVPVDDLGKHRKVSAGRQDERLAGHRDCQHVVPRECGVESAVQFAQTSRAQGVGASVITPV